MCPGNIFFSNFGSQLGPWGGVHEVTFSKIFELWAARMVSASRFLRIRGDFLGTGNLPPRDLEGDSVGLGAHWTTKYFCTEAFLQEASGTLDLLVN